MHKFNPRPGSPAANRSFSATNVYAPATCRGEGATTAASQSPAFRSRGQEQSPGRVRRQRDDGDGAVDAREHERQELEAAAQREGPDLLERHEGRQDAAVEPLARERVRGEGGA